MATKKPESDFSEKKNVPEDFEPVQGIESPELESPKGVSAVADQPEGVMAAGGEFDESATCKRFPWCEVIKWSIVVSAVALVLYLVFRRRD